MSGLAEVPTPSLNVLQRPLARGQSHPGGRGLSLQEAPMCTLGQSLQFSTTLVPSPLLPSPGSHDHD